MRNEERKYYICIRDYQGGEWGVGIVEDLEGWRRTAIGWAETDNMDEAVQYLENGIEKCDILEFISEMWQLEIVEYDESNTEHIDLEIIRGEIPKETIKGLTTVE